MSHSVSSSLDRIVSVDALRGFSLAGIVIVHMVEQYIAAAPPEELSAAMNQGMVDGIIDGVIFILLRGKFFALFSILFGLSFFIQMDRAQQKGEPFTLRFAWRLLILLGIGLFHHAFYSGDILTIYAVVGFFLILFHYVNNKVVLFSASIIFLGLGRYLSFMAFGRDDIFPVPGSEMGSPAYFDTLYNGSVWEVWKLNSWERHIAKINFQISVFGRGYLTLGFFLMGMWIGRTRMLHDLGKYKKLLGRLSLWPLIGGIIMVPIMGLLFNMVDNPMTAESWIAMFAFTAYDLFNLGFTISIGAFFFYLCTKEGWARRLNVFAPYGRTALTNYVSQSILGAFLLYGWGLGLLGQMRNLYMFFIALGVIIIQMNISKFWLNKFYYGPLEWIWRCLTFMKVQRFKREV